MKGIFMDTMTYLPVAACRRNAAERDDELPGYFREKKLIKVEHFLQTSSLLIATHRHRSYGWCCRYVERLQ
jgi:hypothetical protein